MHTEVHTGCVFRTGTNDQIVVGRGRLVAVVAAARNKSSTKVVYVWLEASDSMTSSTFILEGSTTYCSKLGQVGRSGVAHHRPQLLGSVPNYFKYSIYQRKKRQQKQRQLESKRSS